MSYLESETKKVLKTKLSLKLQNRIKGVSAGIVAVIIYASMFLVSRYGVKNNIGIYELAFIRYSIAGMLLLPLFFLRKTSGRSVLTLPQGGLLAIVAGIPYMLLIYFGLKYAPAAHAAAINTGTVPCVVALMTLAKESSLRDKLFKLGSYAAVIVGLFIFTGVSVLQMNHQVIIGDILFFLSGVSWAIFTLLSKKWQADSYELTSTISVISLLYVPIYLSLQGFSKLAAIPTRDILIQGLLQGVGSSIVAMLLFTYSIRKIGANHATLLSPFIPLLTAMMAIPLLHELLSPVQWLGVFLIISGIIFAARFQAGRG